MPTTVIPVKPTTLQKAGLIIREKAQALGQDAVLAVCVELGLDPYLEYDGDRFKLKDLTQIQIVALAAGLAAYGEADHPAAPQWLDDDQW